MFLRINYHNRKICQLFSSQPLNILLRDYGDFEIVGLWL
jgi:hypothetical protein